jgi:hypothetical protein
MGAFIFQVELNAREIPAGPGESGACRRALIIGIDFADGMFNPGAIHRHFRLSFCAQHSEKHRKNCCYLAFKIE